MRFRSDRPPAVGLAATEALPGWINAAPGLVDFVEVPFEQLAHTPGLIETLGVPVVLHCASLSIAGDLPPSPDVVAQLRRWIEVTGTPWLGEHLAFISMSATERAFASQRTFAPQVDQDAELGRTPDAYNVSYTVSPQFSGEILDRVVGALNHWEQALACPLLMENGPIYFETPGSTMSQAEFISRLCERRPATGLLLDLAHLTCTAVNTGQDAESLLESLPLERVAEVHLSGVGGSNGILWDDHAMPIQPLVFDLLERVLSRARPLAITVEYNWDPAFPFDVVREDLRRVRTALQDKRV